MTGSRDRQRRILGSFVAAVLVLLGYLGVQMLERHEEWLERSHRNRWAFRDVPVRRGSITDRHGIVLVRDQPGFRLDLEPEVFAAHHAVGRALCLSAERNAIADAEAGLRLALDQPLPALQRLEPAHRRRLSETLRHYASLSAATPAARSELLAQLRAAARAEQPASLRSLLGAAGVARLESRFHQRLQALRDLDASLGQPARLWPALVAAATPGSQRPAVTFRGLRYEEVAGLALVREQHPGLVVRHDVTRVVDPELTRLAPSLSPFLGTVSGRWQEDAEDPLLAFRPALAELVEEGDELPEGLQQAAFTRAATALKTHLEASGRVGRGGIEAAADHELAGRPGLRWVVRDRKAREHGLWSSLDVAPGRDVALTVDLRLQQIVEEELAALDAPPPGGSAEAQAVATSDKAIVLLAPDSGDVLAVAARVAPERGPVESSAAATWHGPGFLGSVVKPFILLEHLTAARAGRPHATAERFADCSGSYGKRTPFGKELGCRPAHGAAGRDGVLALAHSCNIYFFHAAEGLGYPGLHRAFALAGWLPSDPCCQVGLDVRAYHSRPVLEAAQFAIEQHGIGYGLSASALLVARAYAALATGALTDVGLRLGSERERRPLPVAPEDLEVVRAGLQRCVGEGTARHVEGLRQLRVLGKTGTAQVTVERGSGHGDNNAWFAGYLTRERPTLAFAAAFYGVPHGVHGGDVAAEFVGRCLQRIAQDETLRRLYVPEGGQ
jgi:cell division protein FtsI/penicillin-binding protein 2